MVSISITDIYLFAEQWSKDGEQQVIGTQFGGLLTIGKGLMDGFDSGSEN